MDNPKAELKIEELVSRSKEIVFWIVRDCEGTLMYIKSFKSKEDAKEALGEYAGKE